MGAVEKGIKKIPFATVSICIHNLKTATIDNIHIVLHQVLELGVEDDYLRYNPADNALKELKKAHNNDSERRRALTLPEQEVFEAFLSKQGQYHRWFSIFTVMQWLVRI